MILLLVVVCVGCASRDTQMYSKKIYFSSRLKLSAEQNNPQAQYDLGNCFHFGRGVEPDQVEAVKWWQKAAEHDHPLAVHHLAHAYNKGNGIGKDEAKAVKWYRVGAMRGLSWSQYDLGVMYFRAKGVDKDYIKSLAWWTLASKQGNNDAIKWVEILRQELTPDQITKAESLVRELRKKIESNPKAIKK